MRKAIDVDNNIHHKNLLLPLPLRKTFMGNYGTGTISYTLPASETEAIALMAPEDQLKRIEEIDCMFSYPLEKIAEIIGKAFSSDVRSCDKAIREIRRDVRKAAKKAFGTDRMAAPQAVSLPYEKLECVTGDAFDGGRICYTLSLSASLALKAALPELREDFMKDVREMLEGTLILVAEIFGYALKLVGAEKEMAALLMLVEMSWSMTQPLIIAKSNAAIPKMPAFKVLPLSNAPMA